MVQHALLIGTDFRETRNQGFDVEHTAAAGKEAAQHYAATYSPLYPNLNHVLFHLVGMGLSLDLDDARPWYGGGAGTMNYNAHLPKSVGWGAYRNGGGLRNKF